MEKLLKYVLSKRGELAVAATYICAVSTFIVAYTHPTRSVLVTVNGFNEAGLEIVLILLSLPAVVRFLADGLLGDRGGSPHAPLEPDAHGLGGLTPTPIPLQAPLPGAGLSLRPWGASVEGGLARISEKYFKEGRLAMAHPAISGEVGRVLMADDQKEPWVI